MFYSALIPNLGLRAIVNGFKKKYPFVAIESWRGTKSRSRRKMLAELRAGTPVGDTLEGSELAPLFLKSGLLQKFTSPELGKIPPLYRDKSGQDRGNAVQLLRHAYNTKLVPTGTQPKTFQDLLNTKWKNRMAWRVGSNSGAHMFVANIMLTMGDAAANGYLQHLPGRTSWPSMAPQRADRSRRGRRVRDHANRCTASSHHRGEQGRAGGLPIRCSRCRPPSPAS